MKQQYLIMILVLTFLLFNGMHLFDFGAEHNTLLLDSNPKRFKNVLTAVNFKTYNNKLQMVSYTTVIQYIKKVFPVFKYQKDINMELLLSLVNKQLPTGTLSYFVMYPYLHKNKNIYYISQPIDILASTPNIIIKPPNIKLSSDGIIIESNPVLNAFNNIMESFPEIIRNDDNRVSLIKYLQSCPNADLQENDNNVINYSYINDFEYYLTSQLNSLSEYLEQIKLYHHDNFKRNHPIASSVLQLPIIQGFISSDNIHFNNDIDIIILSLGYSVDRLGNISDNEKMELLKTLFVKKTIESCFHFHIVRNNLYNIAEIMKGIHHDSKNIELLIGNIIFDSRFEKSEAMFNYYYNKVMINNQDTTLLNSFIQIIYNVASRISENKYVEKTDTIIYSTFEAFEKTIVSVGGIVQGAEAGFIGIFNMFKNIGNIPFECIVAIVVLILIQSSFSGISICLSGCSRLFGRNKAIQEQPPDGMKMYEK